MEKKKLDNIDLPLYSISTTADLLGISVHTIRMYEREGLIIPPKNGTAHRKYSQKDIERIKCLRDTINNDKINIQGIKRIQSLLPCWEIIKCSDMDRKNCDSFRSHSKPCWTFNHTKNICTKIDCRSCEVYKSFNSCIKIKELIISSTLKNREENEFNIKKKNLKRLK